MAWTFRNVFEDFSRLGKEDLHLYWLNQDSEFTASLGEYLSSLGLKENDYKGATSALIEGRCAPFIKNHEISEDELAFIIAFQDEPVITSKGLHEIKIDKLNPKYFHDDASNTVIKVEYFSWLDYELFLESWKEIKEVLDSNRDLLKRDGRSRRRAHDDTQLTYAIYKQRSKGETFASIFNKYKEGTLDMYYNMPRNQFEDVDSFRRYYNRHKPRLRGS